MKSRRIQNDGLEPELKRHLGPVKAPDELWDRVHGAEVFSVEQAGTSRPRMSWAWGWVAASVATVVVVAGIVWLNRGLTSEELAVRALSRAPDQMEFRSGDLAELRTWVKAGTGLDIPLPGRVAPSVQLVGANVTRNGAPTAEISYRVGSLDATLVISKAPADGDGRHTIVKSGSYHGANFLSWTMRGQMYTIASADARVGCMLCHSTGAPRTL
ncbi:MAG: hypothetical protein JWO19_5716 [Bryobacterales bacterium]|jgi:anti-sigma factor RsiW|nr:hypothetical protein [Bryobacterales bacterium]